MGWMYKDDDEPLTKEDLQEDWSRAMRGYKPSIFHSFKGEKELKKSILKRFRDWRQGKA